MTLVNCPLTRPTHTHTKSVDVCIPASRGFNLACTKFWVQGLERFPHNQKLGRLVYSVQFQQQVGGGQSSKSSLGTYRVSRVWLGCMRLCLKKENVSVHLFILEGLEMAQLLRAQTITHYSCRKKTWAESPVPSQMAHNCQYYSSRDPASTYTHVHIPTNWQLR